MTVPYSLNFKYPFLVLACLLLTFNAWGQFLTPAVKTNIFPFQSQHVHGSTLVQLPNGSLLVAWFQGSGERQADDVAIMGARLLPEDSIWSKPFVLADVPNFPDTNPVLFIDPQERLWLMWYTVLANQWESSLLKYRISQNYQQKTGPPEWQWQEVLHMKPGGKTEQGIQAEDPFATAVEKKFTTYGRYLDSTDAYAVLPGSKDTWRKRFQERTEELIDLARGQNWVRRGMAPDSTGKMVRTPMGYPQFRRLGWQTRNKPLFLPSGRMIVPLYSDGFDFSLMALTDDGGKHWHFSEPLVGIGNVQPTLAQKTDGNLVAYMRDNGPPPQRVMVSTSPDEGKTWTLVHDSEILNPGAACDMVALRDGSWVLVNNDTEDGRHSLALYRSQDEGKTWKIIQHLERDMAPNTQVRAHYPAIVEGIEGNVHITYSYQEEQKGKVVKTIRYVKVQMN